MDNRILLADTHRLQEINRADHVGFDGVRRGYVAGRHVRLSGQMEDYVRLDV